MPAARCSRDDQAAEVEVVALDWKWLFIYPEHGHRHGQRARRAGRSADQFQDHRVLGDELLLHSGAGRQIYAMPGMETKLHAVINKPGEYEGFSANYSGAGFSGMRFKFHGLTRPPTSTQWVAAGQGSRAARSTATAICNSKSRARTSRCATTPASIRPVRRHPQHVRRARQDVHERDDGHRRQGRRPSKECAKRWPLQYDKLRRRSRFRAEPTYVASVCTHEQAACSNASESPRPQRRPIGATACRAGVLTPMHAGLPTLPSVAPIRMKVLHVPLRPAHAGGDSATRADPARHLRRVALGGIALLGAITYFKLWGYLWREWFTSVDHKKIGIMYMVLGARHAAARLRRRDHDARCSRRSPSTARRLSCRRTTTTRSSPRTA
jgi:hypothetical protein